MLFLFQLATVSALSIDDILNKPCFALSKNRNNRALSCVITNPTDDDSCTDLQGQNTRVFVSKADRSSCDVEFLGNCGRNCGPIRDLCFEIIGISETWPDALKQCSNRGGHLFIPDNDEDLQSLIKMINGKVNRIWIGGGDIFDRKCTRVRPEEGEQETAVTFTIEESRGTLGYMKTRFVEEKYPYVCAKSQTSSSQRCKRINGDTDGKNGRGGEQRDNNGGREPEKVDVQSKKTSPQPPTVKPSPPPPPPRTTPPPPPPTPPPRPPTPPAPPPPPRCPTNWLGVGPYYYLIGYAKTWWDAERDCANRGGHLFSIPDNWQNGQLKIYAQNCGSPGFWVGAHRIKGQFDFFWSDWTPVQYTQWAWGEPNGNKPVSHHCVYFSAGTSTWSDEDCRSTRNYICKKWEGPGYPVPQPPLAYNCPAAPGWIYWQDPTTQRKACYWQGRSANWMKAQRVCEYTPGANLVSLQTQAESNYVAGLMLMPSLFDGGWIGGYRVFGRYEFAWTDTTPFGRFVNGWNYPWNPPHPVFPQGDPTYFEDEQCLSIFGGNQGGRGKWADANCLAEMSFVCKINIL